MQHVALVTGGAMRLGAAITRLLAARGWAVAIHCRRSEKEAHALEQEINAAGGKAAVVAADFSRITDTERLMAKAGKALGPVSLLVNNAALFEKDNLASLTPEMFENHHAVNLRAPLFLSRDFAAQLPEGVPGHIINLLDGCNGWSISPHYLSYSIGKLALSHVTELLALELAPRIRVNGIAPGPTLPGAQDDVETFSRLAARIPMQRVSSPQDVIAAFSFLLDTDSITGEIIHLSGGMQLLSLSRPGN